MRRLFVARTEHELDNLRPHWVNILRESPFHGVFQQFDIARLAGTHFAQRETPHFVVAESDSGLAIIPAVIRTDKTIALVGEALFDYRDVLASGDPDVLRYAWTRLMQLRMPLSVVALRDSYACKRWQDFAPQPFANAPCTLRTHTSADEFSSTHSRLGSRARRLSRRGVELQRHAGMNSGLIRWIYEQKGSQPARQANVFADALRREFMVRMAAEPASRCEVFTYECNEKVVASLVTFLHGHTRNFYTIYFDQRWAEHSPGQSLVYEATALSLAEGLDCDYMTGEYPYKLRVATDTVRLYRVEASAEKLLQIIDGDRLGELVA
ncbi:MAG TPA: GNAT family N-acetyltransferase [Clostridia bacterium]|nr:GNAT family N-acetyltransferase [Clostridia bacterium]